VARDVTSHRGNRSGADPSVPSTPSGPSQRQRAGLSPREREVLALVDEDDLLDVARALVRVPGTNPPGEEAARAAVLAAVCRDRGLEVGVTEVAPGRPNLVATLPGSDPGGGLLLLGHTDVVPVGEGWTVDPFGAEVRGGRLFGRGSADMLGGLAACVAAMDTLRRAGVELSGPVALAALVDEEETGLGIRRLVRELDGSTWAGCLVAEPTDLRTIVAARGDCYLEIEVHGVAAHSGNPADGRNAVYGAAEVVTDLERWHHELADRAHPLVGPPTVSVGIVQGGRATSTVPDHCRISVDRRLLPGEDPAAVLAEVRSRIERLDLGSRGLTVEVSMPMDMPGFEVPVDHPFVVTADRALTDAGGPGLEPGGWTAACDGGFVARDHGIPVVVQGPGSVAEQAHRPDESVAVADLALAARAYALTALRLLARP